MPKEAADLPPAALASVELNRDVFGAGATLSVALTFDGDVSDGVTLALQTAPPLQIPLLEHHDRTYVFERVLSTITNDGEYPLVVSYTDGNGNRFDEVATGKSVRLDFSPPLVVSATTSVTTALASGGLFDLAVVVSEDLAEPPLITLDTGVALALDPTSSAPLFVYSVPVDDSTPEGPREVRVSLTDEASNHNDQSFAALFNVDHTAPDLAGPALSFGSPASLGGSVGARLRFTETLAAPPVVSLIGSDAVVHLVPATALGLDYVASVSVDATLVDDTYELRLDDASDPAGNHAATRSLGTITIDTHAPTFVGSISSSALALSRVAGHDSAEVSFHLSEDVGTNDQGLPRLAVTVGPTEVTCTRTVTPGDAHYTCAYTPTPLDTEGARQIVVTAIDTAGNLAFATGPTLLLDFTPPGFAVAPSLSRSDLFARAQLTPDSLYLNQVAVDGSGQPTVTAAFATNETLAALPTFSLPGVVIESSSLGGFVFARYTPQFPLAEGPHALEATLVDPAGNSATLQVGTIHIDTVPPLLDASVLGSLTYYRSLWDNPPLGTPLIRLDIAQPLEAEATLFVYDGDSFFTGGLIGTFEPTAGPLSSVPLPSNNRARIYVALRDRAGNLHGPAPTLVKKGRFVTTMVADIGAAPAQNPQVSTRVFIANDSLAHAGPLAAEQQLAPVLDEADGAYTAVLANDQDIVELTSAASGPPDRALCAMAVVDSGPLVVFGGKKNTSALGDTWLFDGSAWTSGPGGPAGRYLAGMSRKTGNLSQGRTVLFGGTNGSNALCDTWRWDGNIWLQNLSDDQCSCGVGTCPSARFAHGQTFVDSFDAAPINQAVVVTGGVCAGDVTCDDVRINAIDTGFEPEWLASPTLQPYEQGAVQRAYHALAFAGTPANLLFSFAGARSVATTWTPNADLWTWDGNTWTQLCSESLICETASGPAACACTTSPPARYSPTFFWDEQQRRLVMLAGTSDRAGNNRLHDVWVWPVQGPGAGDWQKIHDFTTCAALGPGCEWRGSDDGLLSQATFARDASRHVTWRFGGVFGMMPSTFVMLSDRRLHAPALQVEVDWSVAGLEASPQTATIQAVAAASSEFVSQLPGPPQPATGNLRLEALRQDEPRHFDVLGSAFANPLELVPITGFAGVMANYTMPDQRMYFRLVPDGSTGSAATGAELRVDWIEFVFDYTL